MPFRLLCRRNYTRMVDNNSTYCSHNTIIIPIPTSNLESTIPPARLMSKVQRVFLKLRSSSINSIDYSIQQRRKWIDKLFCNLIRIKKQKDTKLVIEIHKFRHNLIFNVLEFQKFGMGKVETLNEIVVLRAHIDSKFE